MSEELSFVYFIADTHSRVKIGCSRDPYKRLRHLQTSTSDRLHILGAVIGSAVYENRLHHKFAKDRLKGEWFKLSTEISTYIGKYTIPIIELAHIVAYSNRMKHKQKERDAEVQRTTTATICKDKLPALMSELKTKLAKSLAQMSLSTIEDVAELWDGKGEPPASLSRVLAHSMPNQKWELINLLLKVAAKKPLSTDEDFIDIMNNVWEVWLDTKSKSILTSLGIPMAFH